MPDSPAQLAGLQADDVITGIAGNTVRHWIQLSDLIRTLAGEEVSLAITRKGEPLSLTLKPDTVVEEVVPQSAADGAKLQAGDKIESINGKSPSLSREILTGATPPETTELALDIERQGERRLITVNARGVKETGIRAGGKIGIVPAEELTFKRYGIADSIREIAARRPARGKLSRCDY